jgi:hypothetical protein
MKNYRILFFLFVIQGFLFAGSSIFGFGPQGSAFYKYSYSTAALGRGGVETAVLDTIGINYHNFATWSYNSRTMLSMDMMFESRTVKMPGSEYYTGDAKFTGAFLSFPVLKHKVNMGVGLCPLVLNDQQFNRPFSSENASGRELVKTSGNISEATLSIAMNMNKNLAFALVGRYAFGMIRDKISILYSESFLGDIFAENKYRVSGFGLRFDAFYMVTSRLHSGFSVSLPLKTDLEVSQEAPSSALEKPSNHTLQFPLNLAGGLSFALSDKWWSGVDINWASWKKDYKIDGIFVNNMNDSYRMGIGIEKRPVYAKKEKFTYRGGLFYGQLNMYSNFGNIDEYGVGFGLGIPLLLKYNRLDIALEIGKRGKMNINLAEETFMRFDISLSASEFWFIRDDGR